MKNRLTVPAGATAPACARTALPAREQPMQGLLLAGCPDFWRLWSVGLVVFTVRWLEPCGRCFRLPAQPVRLSRCPDDHAATAADGAVRRLHRRLGGEDRATHHPYRRRHADADDLHLARTGCGCPSRPRSFLAREFRHADKPRSTPVVGDEVVKVDRKTPLSVSQPG
jgi:hypothetical protein